MVSGKILNPKSPRAESWRHSHLWVSAGEWLPLHSVNAGQGVNGPGIGKCFQELMDSKRAKCSKCQPITMWPSVTSHFSKQIAWLLQGLDQKSPRFCAKPRLRSTDLVSQGKTRLSWLAVSIKEYHDLQNKTQGVHDKTSGCGEPGRGTVGYLIIMAYLRLAERKNNNSTEQTNPMLTFHLFWAESWEEKAYLH